jgi:hypothetical protein
MEKRLGHDALTQIVVPARKAEGRSMMHHDFFDSYRRYVKARGQAKS